jgi:hypothetical protein
VLENLKHDVLSLRSAEKLILKKHECDDFNREKIRCSLLRMGRPFERYKVTDASLTKNASF